MSLATTGADGKPSVRSCSARKSSRIRAISSSTPTTNRARAASSQRIPGPRSYSTGMRSGASCVSRDRSCMRSQAKATITSRVARGGAASQRSRAPRAHPSFRVRYWWPDCARRPRQFGTPDPFTAPEDDQEPGLRLPRPDHWGGYRLWAAVVELWVEGEHRLHDRARWTRVIAPARDGRFQAEPWHHERLQP